MRRVVRKNGQVKRAHAYDFPPNAFSRGGRPTDETQSQRCDTERKSANSDAGDEQQYLNVVADEDLGGVETWGYSDATTGTTGTVAGSENQESAAAPTECEEKSQKEDLQRELRAAINALEAVDKAL